MNFKNKAFMWVISGWSILSPLGCREQVKFPGFNSQSWIADAFGCQSVRSKMLPDLEKIRLDLRGLRTTDIMGVLGKPDSEGLLANNERIYYYYVQSGEQCQDRQKLSAANKLQVRFDALERASEVNFEQPIQSDFK
jgi:hypothetical protein